MTLTYRAAAIARTGRGGYGHGPYLAYEGHERVEFVSFVGKACYPCAVAALEMILGAYESQISGVRVEIPMTNRQHPLVDCLRRPSSWAG